jgi:hypothetical protein
MLVGDTVKHNTSIVYKITCFYRVLKTPTEEIWPGVSQLPDYKATFPNWVHYNLTSHAKNIEEDGLDLLQVLVQVALCGRFQLFEFLLLPCVGLAEIPPIALQPSRLFVL